MTDRQLPKQIPQFSVNSNVKLHTQMQVNLHCISRSRGSGWKNALATQQLQELFEEDIARAGSLPKQQAVYLTNGVFCNYTELAAGATSRRGPQPGGKLQLAGSTVLEIHHLLFELVQYFCRVDKSILDQ